MSSVLRSSVATVCATVPEFAKARPENQPDAALDHPLRAAAIFCRRVAMSMAPGTISSPITKAGVPWVSRDSANATFCLIAAVMLDRCQRSKCGTDTSGN
jgi:hypothetical protein